MGDPVTIAIVAGLAGSSLSGLFGKGQKMPKIANIGQTKMPEITNEQASSEALARARKRRGYGSTLLAGGDALGDVTLGKKQLLGT